MSRDRDRILEDALKHELRAARPEPGQGEVCLDAETLAAWGEGGLNAAAMEAVELHLSTCPRCQSMAAAFLRSDSTFAQGTAAPDPEPGTTAPGTWAWWKWLTPLAAGAAAVTLWMVVPEQREIAEAPPQPAQTAPQVAESMPAAVPSESVAPAAPALRDSSSRAANQNQVKAETVETKRQDAAAPGQSEARKERAAADTAVTLEQASPVTAAPAAAAAPAPPAPAALPPPAAAEPGAVAGLQRRAEFAFVPLEIVSPAAAQRWRVGTNGIELSTDAGANWSLVRAAAGETLTAGTSPSASVCWLIGNNGVVLLTTNGTIFTRVDIPDAGNLRSIAATSGRSATVVNAAGRTFRTDDSGRTWR